MASYKCFVLLLLFFCLRYRRTCRKRLLLPCPLPSQLCHPCWYRLIHSSASLTTSKGPLYLSSPQIDSKALVSLEFHPAVAVLIHLGGLSIMWYHPRLIINPLRCALNHLSTWFGINADWCALAEAGLGVEAANSPSHPVNTFAMRINAYYFASVKGPINSYVLQTYHILSNVCRSAISNIPQKFFLHMTDCTKFSVVEGENLACWFWFMFWKTILKETCNFFPCKIRCYMVLKRFQEHWDNHLLNGIWIMKFAILINNASREIILYYSITTNFVYVDGIVISLVTAFRDSFLLWERFRKMHLVHLK